MTIILVGCGNMGFAMLAGWIAGGKAQAGEVFVIEPNGDLRARAARLGCFTAERPDDLPENVTPFLVIFAVKPQVMREVVPAYARFKHSGASFLSIAAGTPVSTFLDILGEDAAIIRCMPNTPAAIGKGMMVIFANDHVDARARDLVGNLLSANGEVTTIDDESLMDAVTAVSGSGPAYIFHFIECLSAAAEEVGLQPEAAKLLAMQTVYGAACLAFESRTDPGELRRQVTSPNGTTAAALDVLMGDDRLKRAVVEAVVAARDRGVELRS